jgi:3-oxoacyl-[acyl-carrier protein] reductase
LNSYYKSCIELKGETLELRAKVALITGGGTGLGREIALQLAQAGMHIAINYSRSKVEAEETVKDLRELGVEAQAFQVDLNSVTALADTKQLVENVAQRWGRLDLVINNAGVTKAVPFADLAGLEEADWDYVLQVNTKVPFFVARAAAQIMRQNGGGQVINTASIAGLRPIGSSLAYAVSKAGMIHLTKCLAVALAPTIQVNAVAPGLLQTRWYANFSPAMLKTQLEQTPLKRIATLEDVAATYLMLARNNSITGQIITVDTGVTL